MMMIALHELPFTIHDEIFSAFADAVTRTTISYTPSSSHNNNDGSNDEYNDVFDAKSSVFTMMTRNLMVSMIALFNTVFDGHTGNKDNYSGDDKLSIFH